MQKNHVDVWNECLVIIRDTLNNNYMYKTWFEPIKPLQLEDKILTIQVPSPFFYEWLEENYVDLLRKTIRRVIGPEAKLLYSYVVDSGAPRNTVQPSSNKLSTQNRPVSVPVDINREKTKDFPNPFIIPGLQKLKIDSQLNENLSFDNFIEGECNRLARSAGYAASKNPGKSSFNPLFIYSSVGLGKTHLAHAIGLETKKNFPDKTVLYVTSEQFFQQYTQSIMNNSKNDFMRFYQMIDLLIIDDIQFLANKNKTQEAFFHIFNALNTSGKQLVITSDKNPSELEDFEQRVISRFKWGLNCDLQVPDIETRIKILKSKLYNDGIDIDDEVVEYLAYNINSSVRELEGALISLLAQSSYNKKTITIDLAREMIDKFVKTNSREITIEYIQKIISDYFNLPIERMNSNTRKHEIVRARQLSMFFAKKHTNNSLKIIGEKCGNKNHATVLHSCNQVEKYYETDKNFRVYVDDIERKLNE